MRALDAIATRRSIRRFAPREVSPNIVREIIAAAVAAPAPHHSRPWRFVEVGPEARTGLSEAMAEAWRADAAADGLSGSRIESALARSRKQMAGAPLLLLACLELDSARSWPDDRRRAAERDMYMQSLGAALQNMLLAAHARVLHAASLARDVDEPRDRSQLLTRPAETATHRLLAELGIAARLAGAVPSGPA